MHYSVLRLRDVRMAVVLVEIGQVNSDRLLGQLQTQFALPVMLVARDEGGWKGVKARAQFDASPYLSALLALDDVEWAPVPAPADPEIPF